MTGAGSARGRRHRPPGPGEQLVAQEPADAGVGRRGLVHGVAQSARGSVTEHGIAGLGVLDQVVEVAVLLRELGTLGRAGLNLPLGADQTPGRRGTQRLDVAVERRRDLGHAGRERQPLRICVGGHQVEDVADPLKRGGQDVEGHLVEPGGVGLLGQAETLLHRRDGHAVDVVDRGRLGQGVESPAAQVGLGAVAGRREVVEVLVVAGDPQLGRGDGTELDERVEVVVRNAVNVGGGAHFRPLRVSGHRSNVPQRAPDRWMRQRERADARQPPGPWGCVVRTIRRGELHWDWGYLQCEEERGFARVGAIVATHGGEDGDEGGELLRRGVAADQAQRSSGRLRRLGAIWTLGSVVSHGDSPDQSGMLPCFLGAASGACCAGRAGP